MIIGVARGGARGAMAPPNATKVLFFCRADSHVALLTEAVDLLSSAGVQQYRL